MKLIEAMKKIKIIDKRITKNCEQIQQYAAWVSTETPVFNSTSNQIAEVQSLVQANLDLEKEYLQLKKAIERTNLETDVSIGTFTYSISELLTLKDKVSKDGRTKLPGAGQFRARTYLALNGAAASQRMQQVYSKGIDGTNPPKVIIAFDEAAKNNALREWDEFMTAIDGKLEVVNAETDLKAA